MLGHHFNCISSVRVGPQSTQVRPVAQVSVAVPENKHEERFLTT